MAFWIIRTSPVYCQITDGQIGSTSRGIPYAYETQALAHKLAGRMEQESYDGCGDDHFWVAEYGTYNRIMHPGYAVGGLDSDYMPF